MGWGKHGKQDSRQEGKKKQKGRKSRTEAGTGTKKQGRKVAEAWKSRTKARTE